MHWGGVLKICTHFAQINVIYNVYSYESHKYISKVEMYIMLQKKLLQTYNYCSTKAQMFTKSYVISLLGIGPGLRHTYQARTPPLTSCSSSHQGVYLFRDSVGQDDMKLMFPLPQLGLKVYIKI